MAISGIKTIIRAAGQYQNYHVEKISTNRFTHQAFINVLSDFEREEQLSFKDIGYSEEGRAIRSVTFGKGKTKVLLWSQMHGNESTATRAILDILKFLTANDELNSFREQIADKLTLQFIPMLNPDGTNRFQRRTATEIDMNRDAVELQTPEGRLLMDVIDDFKPGFALNLHDQRRFYNVKGTEVPSSMSFLAPAYNEGREVNTTRKKAMQLIAGMNQVLQNRITGGVGLYDDTYSFRSFGDAIQAKGISTILVESGWLANDMEKEGVRKLNFLALLSAFQMIAENSYTKFSVEDYINIPPIDTKLFDVLIKNVSIDDESDAKVDLGINRTEHLLEAPNYYSIGWLEDLGDLSAHYGFETVKEKGLKVIPGKSIVIDKLEVISMISVKRLLRQGVLFLITPDVPLEAHVPFPINLVHPRKLQEVQTIKFDSKANFLLVDNLNKIKFIILNGFLINPAKIDTSVNGLVLV
ncbi:MAG: peptidase M14 [Cyclobacteriaceae bacterium]|nr:peptidase M14 [Cyclobacteriaceae bacterium]